MTGSKIGALIPIRLASERLPGKALKHAVGKPMVCHLLDRVFSCRHISDPRNVIVCTTEDESDDPLVTTVEAHGASIFRGDRDDLIKRLFDAARTFDLDIILQVDGDDILCDTQYMDLTIGGLLENSELDVMCSEGLPFGINSKSFTMAALERVYSHYRTSKNDTGFAYYFTKTGLCNVGSLGPVSPDHVDDKIRLTLDYEDDLTVFRHILEGLGDMESLPGLSDIIRFLRENPEVASLNLHHQEDYWARHASKAQLEFVDTAGETQKIEV